ncbi:uncharacterized protein STEHIDRAFT_116253 [Stereum hirsutum FP-91666 SS1]|uniref:Uncharacterized protein n=1 Tax=Stereum hirsutum (strain FP-91666) TaxID=721885 RepID=R7RXZ7_STEHR|nr:uncharacterized protein STEHIDRAFT_116253 [Stereum hirsutum FP-91666 SS1]EIM79770.1 hypothetical protein STEHIDRAFT_116253 [Stereum hirsutum FP-91666 SS1]
MALYQGFLGSEATRFPGQDTVDIHLTHWRNHPVRPLRQRTIALTQGMSFISIEQMLPFANPAGGPPVWSWVPSLTFTVAVQLWCIGPSQPALPGLPLPNPVPYLMPLEAVWLNGAWRFGYSLPWGYDVHEIQVAQFAGMPQQLQGFLHYYKSQRRIHHNVTPTMIPNGPHKYFFVLAFGTQWNMFRRSWI